VLQLAVDDAEETEWQEQLQQQAVHQHQVAEGELAGRHPLPREQHHRGHRDGDHRPLHDVEK
jgi:hypothetical protein